MTRKDTALLDVEHLRNGTRETLIHVVTNVIEWCYF